MSRVMLLLPSTTYRAGDFMAAAAKLGVDVVVASEHRQALSRSQPERTLVVSLEKPQRGALVAALAGEALGLRGNPPGAVRRAGDKAAMRAAFTAAGVRQPAYRHAHDGSDVGALAMEVGLPCVVKPVGLAASQGVIRADSPSDAAAAAERARTIAAAAGRPDDLLVERFAPGAEVAVEGLLRDGTLTTLAVFDKPDPLDGPYFEETIYLTPSSLPEPTLANIDCETAAAARALGLVEGPIHAELRVDRSGTATVLELAARSIGGLCARTLRFGLGVSLEELILRHALGRSLGPLEREPAAAGVMMIPIPAAGVLVEVRGVDRARARPGVGGVEITIPRGRRLTPLPEGDRYLGFLFAKGRRPEDVEAALRSAHAELEVVVDASTAAAS